jgi:hypothetical protein
VEKIMSIFSRIFGAGEDPRKRENVVLLIKMKTRTGGMDEKRVVVERSQIQAECDALGERTDLAEVWVYQKILHHTFPEKTDNDPSDTSAVLAGPAMLAFGAGKI